MTEAQTSGSVRWSLVLWWVAAILLYLSFGYTEMMGSDLWWHLAAGRELVTQQTPWLRDAWSYTEAGSPWHNHEWLADLVFFGWAKLFSVPALVYWKWLVLLMTFVGLQQVLLRSCGDLASAVICTAAALAVAAPFLDIRPHLYSLAGLVSVFWLVLDRTPRRLPVFLLFVLWTNLHSGVVFGLMALGLLLFPWRDLRVTTLTQAAMTLAIAALACLCNPDGLKVFIYPLEYALGDSPYRTLAEWLSPLKAGGIRAPLYFPALALALPIVVMHGLRARRGRAPMPWGPLSLCVLTVAMSLTSRRFIPLYAISLSLLAAPLLALLLIRLNGKLFPTLLALLAAGVGFWRMAPLPLTSGPAYHYLTAEYVYPEATVDVILANAISGPTFAYYNWGGYLHWRTNGAVSVFLDGRANTVFDDATYLQYLQVAQAAPGWVNLVEDSGADFFLWPRFSAGGQRLLTELWQTGRWQLVYRGDRAVLMARQGVQLPDTLVLPKTGIGQDLTGARNALVQGDYLAAAAAARQVRAVVPWHRGGCSLLAAALRGQGDTAGAASVINDCRRYFPTRYLR